LVNNRTDSHKSCQGNYGKQGFIHIDPLLLDKLDTSVLNNQPLKELWTKLLLRWFEPNRSTSENSANVDRFGRSFIVTVLLRPVKELPDGATNSLQFTHSVPVQGLLKSENGRSHRFHSLDSRPPRGP
jgi:hypothetical protein